MKKSELISLINECINEERKSRKDKVQEKWQILAKITGGKEYKSKWYTDWNDAYDALGPFVQDLDKNMVMEMGKEIISLPQTFLTIVI